MNKRKIIKNSCFQLSSPIVPSITFWLLLDRIQAPGYAYGIIGTIMGIYFTAWIADLCNTNTIDIFKETK